MSTTEDELQKGKFMDSLVRNNKQIKDDRALAIAEDAELIYKRKVEDLETTLKRKKRDRENMLDMSPSHAQSLILASDFDATSWVDKDHLLGLEVRNLEIELDLAKARYQQLFKTEVK